MIGPSCSMASENRSRRSREPLRSSEFISTRHRIQVNAFRILTVGVIRMEPASDPVQRGLRFLAADERDKELFERMATLGAPAQLVDPALRDQPASGDHADMRREPFDDFEDVRRQEDRPAAGDERNWSESLICRDATASMPSKGSSRNRRRGAGSSAAARESFLRMPWEKSVTSVLAADQIHELEQVVRSRGGRRVVDAVHLSDERQRFVGGQPIEEREILRDDANAALDGDRIGKRDTARGFARSRTTVSASPSGT